MKKEEVKNAAVDTAENTIRSEAQAEDTGKKRSVTVYVRGVLASAYYGRPSFNTNGEAKKKYRISIQANEEDMKKLVEATTPYFKDTDPQWIPKWFSDPEAREYLNLSSNYDIKAGYRNPNTKRIEELGDLISSYIEDNGNVNGSEVVVMVNVKDSSVYPASILFKKIKHTTISDMFSDFDDDQPM